MSGGTIALLVGGGVLAYVAVGFARRAARGCPLLAATPAAGGLVPPGVVQCPSPSVREILLWPLAGVTEK